MALEELTRGLGAVSMPAADIAPDDDATLFYTSGSTGKPKGVASTHRNILSALLSWEVDRGIAELMASVRPPPTAEQPATLLAVPLFHVTGSHAVYLQCYRMQRRLVSMYRWDAEQAALLIAAERISSFIAPSAMTGDLERLAREGRHDLSSLLSVGGGGAPRAPEQVHKIRQSFANAMPGTGWGMTETNSIGTTIGGEDYLARPASSGRCSVVLDLKIVDGHGAEVPDGTAGELLVRGASVFMGYWQRPEANAESFIDDWFRTGDVAARDAEGFIFIVDRIKDVIIRGGENIGCGQVEAALLAHPAVHEAAVYGLPDARLGEEVAATVYAPEPLDPEALREYLSGHLARFEVPRVIAVSATPLPRTPSGKIHKRQIRTAALASLSSREG
jgi:long-chain acyl-CoA synthetase